MEYANRKQNAARALAALFIGAVFLCSFCRRAKEDKGATSGGAATAVEAAKGDTTAAPSRPGLPSAPPSASGARRAAKPELQIAVNGLQEGAVLYPGTRALVEVRLRNPRAQSGRTEKDAAPGSGQAAPAAAPIVVGTESRPWLDMVKVFGAPVGEAKESEPVEVKVRWTAPKEAPTARLELDAEQEGTAAGILEAAEIGRFTSGEQAIFAELRADEGGPAATGTFAGRVRSNPVAIKIAAASDKPSEDELDLRAYVEAEAARLEGNESKAREAIAARLAQHPGSIGMRILNAEILESQNRLAEALEDLQKAVDAVKARAGKPGEIKELPDLLISRISRLERKLAANKK